MNLFIKICCFSFIVFVKIFKCWVDEGHMLISAIAYKNLTDNEKAILDKIFMNYKADNCFNDPISGAVWADHIKASDFEYPNNEKREGILNLMNHWHYINIPYNPLNVEISSCHKECYKELDNGLSILKKSLNKLKSIKQRPNCGTYYEYNIFLRYFIHIFGDLHQPLHTTSFFNQNYTDGDHGGDDIFINYNSHIHRLHRLCDNLFFSRDGQWPMLTNDIVFKEADALMKAYPPEYFGNRLKINMRDIKYLDFIVKDSYIKAIKYIYSHFPHDTLNINTAYILSDSAITSINKLLNEQIVLGGYRLTRYLKVIIANIPRDLV